MSLKDFRGQGPPGDIGTFQSPCSVLVYQYTFFGTTYIVAARQGDRGWVLVTPPNTDAAVVIQAAFNIGGKTCIAHGTYTVDPYVSAVASLTVEGEGASTILSMGVRIAVENPLIFVNCADVTVRNLTFDGSYTGAAIEGANGISFLTNAHDCLVENCRFLDFNPLHGAVNDHPIEVEQGTNATRIIVAICFFSNAYNFSVAFASTGGCCIAIGNTVNSPGEGGLEAAMGSYNLFVGNTISNCTTGITLHSTLNTATGNTLNNTLIFINGNNNEVIANTLYASWVEILSADCGIIGNNFILGTQNRGIWADTASCTDLLIIGNTIIGAGSDYVGVYVRDQTVRVRIIGNRIKITGAGASGGVRFGFGTNVDTLIKDNNFNGCTNIIYEMATGSTMILPTLILPFVDGTTFLSADGAAWGWEIDLATEYAIALGHLPREVQQVRKINVRAVSLVAEVHAMRLEINGYGGAANEALTQETIAVANKPSATTNFAANDYVVWTLTSTDDVDIGHLQGDDSVMFKVLHEAAGNGDCQTDAVFLCVEIQYV